MALRRAFIIGVLGMALLTAAGVLRVMLNRGDEIETPGPPVSAGPSAAMPDAVRPLAARPAPPGLGKPTVPSFDVVRVNPQGDAVIAGRAEPNTEVTVLDGDRPIGTVTADSRGEWVLLPSEPLPIGNRALTLLGQKPDGPPVKSEDAVVLVVPTRTDLSTAADAALPASQPPQIAAARPPATGAHAVVERGNSLWQIARQTYGKGTEYHVIYRANRDQIRNPDRIYPGQVFLIPPDR